MLSGRLIRVVFSSIAPISVVQSRSIVIQPVMCFIWRVSDNGRRTIDL